MRVLAIDPGSRDGLGWAILEDKVHVDGGEIIIPAERMQQDDRYALWVGLSTLLFDHLAAGPRVDYIAYERVYSHKSINAAHIYGGQIAILQWVAKDLGVPWIPVSVQSGKRALGHNLSGKAKERGLVDVAAQKGYTVLGPNEADAIGIALAAMIKINAMEKSDT